MSININEVVVYTERTPDKVSFSNFQAIKSYLEQNLSTYNNTAYSIDNVTQAREDLAVLKAVKKRLIDTKKGLEKDFHMPIEQIINQLDELVSMVKEPYDKIDRMLKCNAKKIKENEIWEYASKRMESLGEYKNSILASPAFFNPKWLNITYKERDWKNDIDKMVEQAKIEIPLVKALGGENINAILAFYFDKLSFAGVEDFINNLKKYTQEENPIDQVQVVENSEISAILSQDSFTTNVNEIVNHNITISIVGSINDIKKYIDSARNYNLAVAIVSGNL